LNLSVLVPGEETPRTLRTGEQPPPGAPDPRNFNILQYDAMEGRDAWIAVEVQYPDATNYEGRKIMVFRATRERFLEECENFLDPHFCEGKHLSPFARFEPTEEGWGAAVELCYRMTS